MKRQQCSLASVVGSLISYPVMVAAMFWWRGWIAAVVMAVLVPLAMWGYVRIFPKISRFLGYGSVADEPHTGAVPSARRVTLYTALGCPFCPIMRNRLRTLGEEWAFEFEEVDLTLHPGHPRAREIRAVPAVEINARLHVGHLTTRRLAELLRDDRAPEVAGAVLEAVS